MAQKHVGCQRLRVGSKKFACLREVASAEAGPERPQPVLRAERTLRTLAQKNGENVHRRHSGLGGSATAGGFFQQPHYRFPEDTENCYPACLLVTNGMGLKYVSKVCSV